MTVLASTPIFKAGRMLSKLEFDPDGLSRTSENIALGILTYMVLLLKAIEFERSYGTVHRRTLLAAVLGFELSALVFMSSIQARMVAFLCAWLAQFVLACGWFIQRIYVIYDCFEHDESHREDDEVLRSITTIMGTMAVGSFAVVANVAGTNWSFVTVHSVVWLTYFLYLSAEILHWCIYLAVNLNFASQRLRPLYHPSRLLGMLSLLKFPGRLLAVAVTVVIASRVALIQGDNEHHLIIIFRAIIFVSGALGHTFMFTTNPKDYRDGGVVHDHVQCYQTGCPYPTDGAL
ncbi:hypothetical protein QR680_001252 [Steinernema hermaphroditum]|uniref:Uncharacterized protein n=1 Tax=Steinernema hermaphroditum TaxID=289476 RepID=A0AA39GZ37_9BILA|nr:hypothetical protein QR680_001252 [Steinernema hermaphroditum]